MEELVPIIITAKGNQAVSARMLYQYLEVKTDFTDWIKRMIEYGFEENLDYLKKEETVSKGVTKHDYVLKLSMAKEISMIQRSDRGKQARKYFIACEEKLREIVTPVLPQNYLEALKALTLEVESKERLLAENAILLPKAQAADVLLLSENTISIGELAKTISFGEIKLFKQMREDKFLIPDGQYKNHPYQRFVNQGLLILKEVPKQTKSGTYLFFQTQVTPKGQVYFSNLYSK